jgi:hypothetical protein
LADREFVLLDLGAPWDSHSVRVVRSGMEVKVTIERDLTFDLYLEFRYDSFGKHEGIC